MDRKNTINWKTWLLNAIHVAVLLGLLGFTARAVLIDANCIEGQTEQAEITILNFFIRLASANFLRLSEQLLLFYLASLGYMIFPILTGYVFLFHHSIFSLKSSGLKNLLKLLCGYITKMILNS